MNAIIKPSFWSDPDIEGQPPNNKLVMLWLITNQQTSIIGVCSASPARFEFETKLPSSELDKAIKGLGRSLKVFGDKVFVVNFIRHQWGDGDKLKANNVFRGLCAAVLALKCKDLRNAILTEYPLIRQALPKPSPSPSQALKSNNNPKGTGEGTGEGVQGESEGDSEPPEVVAARKVIEHLNVAAGRRFNPDSPQSISLIKARLAEVKGDVAGVCQMIDRWVEKWKGTEYEEYLQPSTLFAPKKFQERYDLRGVTIVAPQPPGYDWRKDPNHKPW